MNGVGCLVFQAEVSTMLRSSNRSRFSLVVAAALLAGVAGTTLSAGVARADGGASSATSAPAEGGGRHGGHWRHDHHDLIRAALRLPDLTDAQKGQIETLEQSKRAPHVAARRAHEALAKAVAAQLDAPSVKSIDRNQLKPQLQAVISADAAVEAANASALAGLHGVLTPAQRTELADKLSARMAEREQKHAAREAQKSADTAAKTGRASGERGGPWGRALGLSPAQEAQIRANLEAAGVNPPARGNFEAQAQQMLNDFKQPTFTAPVATGPAKIGRVVDMAQAALPVLTDAQRTELANLLRGSQNEGGQDDGS
jgi:Spy/CpxP family protein refolding chaperone